MYFPPLRSKVKSQRAKTCMQRENSRGGGAALEWVVEGGKAEGRAPVQHQVQSFRRLFSRPALNKATSAQPVAKAAPALTFCGSKMEQYEKGA